MKTLLHTIALASLAASSLFAQTTKKTENKMSRLEQTNNHTFQSSDRVTRQKISFKNRYGITLTGDLYIPKNHSGKPLPALAVSGPFGAVKEQSSGLYAQTMAERGFITLAFDPSYTGESGGEPRHVASPDINTEDFSAAVDFLGIQKNIDRNKIGIIGICGFGGFALNAAAVDKRIKAVATTSMYDMSRVNAKGYFDETTLEARTRTLEQLGEQRWADAKTGTPEFAPKGLPDKIKGDEPQFVKDYFDYYKTKRGFHPRSINSNGSWRITSALPFMNMPILTYIDEISPRPLLIIAGEKAHSRYFSEDAFKAAAEPKELLIIPDAVHTDLYDKTDVIPFDKLADFFNKHLVQEMTGKNASLRNVSNHETGLLTPDLINSRTMENKKVTAGRDRLGALAPKFAELNDDVLFGQVWSREQELPARDRSLVTIVSLIAGGNFEQLKFHLQKGKDNGLSKQEIAEIITHQAFYSGWPKAWSAFNVVKEIYAENDAAKNTILEKSTIFPLGDPVNPQWFAGRAWLKMLSVDNPLKAPVGNVTFAPGARDHWHSHKVGQILLITGGEGWHQEWGKPAQKLKEGDVVNIPANAKHWHGAAKDSWFVHLAITPGESEWFEPVADGEYNGLVHTETPATEKASNTMVRLSKITVDPAQLDNYNACLKEEIEASMNLETGVLTLFATAEKENPERITILEIYASEAAYKRHIKTPHFLKYKQVTLGMVQSLELIDTNPLIPGLKIK